MNTRDLIKRLTDVDVEWGMLKVYKDEAGVLVPVDGLLVQIMRDSSGDTPYVVLQ